MFELHPALQKKDYVCDLNLCTVLFEDNKNYPWIFLVPKKEKVKSMRDLTHEEHLSLMNEIELAERVMANLFSPTQTNVAMIGNMTPQLHVHIVCRKKGDPDWPGTVWNSHSDKYEPAEKQAIIAKIKKAFAEKMNEI